MDKKGMLEQSVQESERIRNGGILPPKIDVVFQELFTKGKESITKAMIEKILKMKIDKIDLDKSKDLQNDNVKNKNGRLDLRVILNDNVECDIEIQLVTHDKLIERFLYYWAKMYSASLQIGEGYSNLKKTISIIILDGKIDTLKDVKKAHTKWQIREEENREILLTSYLELHIIELPKAISQYKNNNKDEVLQWMMFLDNPEDVEVTRIMKVNKDIKEAKEELDRISQNDILRRMALKAELERMDIAQVKTDAEKRGVQEGLKQGMEEGMEQKKIEIIAKMIKENMSNELIKKIASATDEQIEKIRKELK